MYGGDSDGFGGGKKTPTKQARRTVSKPTKEKKVDESFLRATASGGDADDDMQIETVTKPIQSKQGEAPKSRPPPMKGGWADNRQSKRGGLGDTDDDRRLRSSSPQEREADSDDDIPNIPELEDSHMPATSTSEHVTIAPLVAVNRVSTHKELENELTKHLAFLTLDNEIDLKLLGKGLSAEADIHEDDLPWEWDQLFTEVSSELTAEWESLETFDERPAAFSSSTNIISAI